jgi:excisionase family DNA binding protein
MLGIARGRAYEHVRNGDIPSVRMGRRLLIPRERFHARLNGETARAKEVA